MRSGNNFGQSQEALIQMNQSQQKQAPNRQSAQRAEKLPHANHDLFCFVVVALQNHFHEKPCFKLDLNALMKKRNYL